jgi:hypothetical protein
MRGLRGKSVLVTGRHLGDRPGDRHPFRRIRGERRDQLPACPPGGNRDRGAGTRLPRSPPAKRSGDVLVRGDVSNEEDVVAMLESAVDGLGGIDVLVNNAGIQISSSSHEILVNNAGVFPAGATHELEEATLDEVLDVNVKAVFLLTASIAPRMAQLRRGTIINVTTMAAEFGIPGLSAYGAGPPSTARTACASTQSPLAPPTHPTPPQWETGSSRSSMRSRSAVPPSRVRSPRRSSFSPPTAPATSKAQSSRSTAGASPCEPSPSAIIGPPLATPAANRYGFARQEAEHHRTEVAGLWRALRSASQHSRLRPVHVQPSQSRRHRNDHQRSVPGRGHGRLRWEGWCFQDLRTARLP